MAACVTAALLTAPIDAHAPRRQIVEQLRYFFGIANVRLNESSTRVRHKRLSRHAIPANADDVRAGECTLAIDLRPDAGGRAHN